MALVWIILELFPGRVNAQQIAAYNTHTCMITPSSGRFEDIEVRGGNVTCWADANDPVAEAAASPPATLTDAVQLCTADTYSCALDSKGALTCWGAYPSGLVPNGPFGNFTFMDVVCRIEAICALLLEPYGDLVCMSSSSGQTYVAGHQFDRLSTVVNDHEGSLDLCAYWFQSYTPRAPMCLFASQPFFVPILDASGITALRMADQTLIGPLGLPVGQFVSLVNGVTVSAAMGCALSATSLLPQCWTAYAPLNSMIPSWSISQLSGSDVHACGVATPLLYPSGAFPAVGNTISCWRTGDPSFAVTNLGKASGLGSASAPSALFRVQRNTHSEVVASSPCAMRVADGHINCWGTQFVNVDMNSLFPPALMGMIPVPGLPTMFVQTTAGAVWSCRGDSCLATTVSFVPGTVVAGNGYCGAPLSAPTSVICAVSSKQNYTLVPAGAPDFGSVSASFTASCYVSFTANRASGTPLCYSQNGPPHGPPWDVQSFVTFNSLTYTYCGVRTADGLLLCTHSFSGPTVVMFTDPIVAEPSAVVVGTNAATQPDFLCALRAAARDVVCTNGLYLNGTDFVSVFLTSLGGIDTVLCGQLSNGQIACQPSSNLATFNSQPLPSAYVGALAPQHFFRSGTRLLPCPPGTFSVSNGAITSLCSGACLPGMLPIVNASNAYCGYACPAGSYCPPLASTLR